MQLKITIEFKGETKTGIVYRDGDNYEDIMGEGLVITEKLLKLLKSDILHTNLTTKR